MSHPASRRLVLALVAAAAGSGPGLASAGEYVVVQCHDAQRGFEDARFQRTHGGDYAFGKHCANAAEGNSLQVRSISGAPKGRRGEIRWHSPLGTSITAVRVEGRLRDDAGHRATLLFRNPSGQDAGVLAGGGSGPTGFSAYARTFSDGGRHAFVARLECRSASCPRSEVAKTWVRGLRLTLRDGAAPKLGLAGTLLAGGWVRGERDLRLAASDVGSGLRRVELRVNGTEVPPTQTFGCATVAGMAWAARLVPCAVERSLGRTIRTDLAPLRNGSNELVACVRDFGPAGNRTCVRRAVAVDNLAPAIRFADRDADDPELIRAPAVDLHSGVAGGAISYRPLAGGEWRVAPTRLIAGELQARVDSAAEPPGRYLLRAEARDRAGNRSATSSRPGGEPMVVEFPLKERARLRARIEGPLAVGYGARPRVSGRLAAAEAGGIGAERVVVVERFAPGSEPRLRRLSARTDREGRFRLRLSPGPSRRVSVAFPGSKRYLAAASRPDRLAVRGRATIRVSPRRLRGGQRARFRGRVGTLGARIPAAGKAVELQAREAGAKRFRTVGRAFRTDRRGRWSTRYRFGRFYRRAVRFQFRLRVTPEARWPYTVARSRARPLTVLPR